MINTSIINMAALARDVGCSRQNIRGIMRGEWAPSKALAAALARNGVIVPGRKNRAKA